MESSPRRFLPATKFKYGANCFTLPQLPLQPPLPKPPPLPPPPPPPPSLPPPLLHLKALHGHTISFLVLVVAAALCFGIACAFIAKCYFQKMAEIRRRRRTNLNPSTSFNTQEEEFEDGPLDHPIWYINTIGLQQSIIDSIAVCKYKRKEGLIEGNECSVCLNEFCEDESLRLLPKCSHAFHLPCIDTWLRSHKNCPVCRAPIVQESRSDDDHVVEESSVNISASQENMSEEAIGEGSNTIGSPVDTPSNYSEGIRENLKMDFTDLNSASCELVGNELHKPVAMEEEMQVKPIKRSVSMNAPIGRIMDNIVQMKNSKASSGCDKRNGGSTSVHRSTRSYSFGPSLQKGLVSMKRSSSSGKIWSSIQWRS